MQLPPKQLGQTSFTVHELCHAVDLRSTACTPLEQMEILSRTLRICVAAALKRQDTDTADKLMALRKSVENSWTSKRNIDAAISDMLEALSQ